MGNRTLNSVGNRRYIPHPVGSRRYIPHPVGRRDEVHPVGRRDEVHPVGRGMRYTPWVEEGRCTPWVEEGQYTPWVGKRDGSTPWVEKRDGSVGQGRRRDGSAGQGGRRDGSTPWVGGVPGTIPSGGVLGCIPALHMGHPSTLLATPAHSSILCSTVMQQQAPRSPDDGLLGSVIQSVLGGGPWTSLLFLSLLHSVSPFCSVFPSRPRC